MLVFILVIYSYTKQLRHSGPAYSIDERGIWKQGEDTAQNRILWENMLEVTIKETNYVNCIMFKINNADEVIASETSALRRKTLAFSIKMNGSHFVIVPRNTSGL